MSNSENGRGPHADSDDVTFDDNTLVARVQNGDIEALGALYDRHADFVYRYFVFRVRDTTTAEDLLQDTFVKVQVAISDGRFDVDAGHAFRNWLTRVAANVRIDHFRRENRRPKEELPMIGDDDEPNTELPAPFQPDPLESIILDDLIDTLSPQARRVLLFRRTHPGLSDADCAERLDMQTDTYKKTMKRAFARIRELKAAQRSEIFDASYPWRNRGGGAGDVMAEPAVGRNDSSSDRVDRSASTLDPVARARIRSTILDTAAAAALQRAP